VAEYHLGSRVRCPACLTQLTVVPNAGSSAEDDKVTGWPGDRVTEDRPVPVTLSPGHPVTLSSVRSLVGQIPVWAYLLGVVVTAAIAGTLLMVTDRGEQNPIADMRPAMPPMRMPEGEMSARGQRTMPATMPPPPPGRLLELGSLQIKPAVPLTAKIEEREERGDLVPAGSLAPWLAAAVAQPSGQPGLVLTASTDGRLRWYDAGDLHLLGSSRLERPAYHLVLDSERGVLYAICAPANRLYLDPMGERRTSAGDLCAYDVRTLLANTNPKRQPGEVPSGQEQLLQPTWQISLDTHILQMLRSPDGEFLYLLRTTPRGLDVQQVSTAKRSLGISLMLRAPVGAITLTPDGRALYATVPNSLMVIDLPALEIRGTYPMFGTASVVMAGTGGRVYLADRNRSCLLVLRPEKNEVLGHWKLPMAGALALAVSANGKRLYVSNSSVASNRIWSLDCAQEPTEPPVRAEVFTDQHGLIRGLSLLTPDDRFLINSAGRVFRVRAGA
jgi:hypothetical protein